MSMKGIYIEIVNEPLITRSGVSQRNGNNYSIREQVGYLHKPGQQYPDKIKVSLGQDQAPYAAGGYDLDPSSFYVGKFGSLEVRPVLVSRVHAQSIKSA